MKNMCTLAGIAALIAGATAASAGTTAVNIATPSDGVSVVTILNNVYGGAFVGSVGTSLTNGSVTATRVQDFVSGPLDPGAQPLFLGAGTGSTDQVWRDGTVMFRAEARFAGYSQYFGYRNSPLAGTGATNSVQIMGSGFGVTTSSNGPWLVGPGQFQWLRAGNAGFLDSGPNGRLYSSVADHNHDNTDHMVTYKISGLGAIRYMLFWEDLPLANGFPGDYDYNDLAIEIETVHMVPLPTGAGLAGLGMLGLTIRRRTR